MVNKRINILLGGLIFTCLCFCPLQIFHKAKLFLGCGFKSIFNADKLTFITLMLNPPLKLVDGKVLIKRAH